MDQLIAIFCDIDDFCKAFEPVYARRLLHTGQRQRRRQTTLSLSEILTRLVYFHWRHYRTFKHYYMEYVVVHLHTSFPRLVSYQRFVELLPRTVIPLCGYLSTRKGRHTGIACIDSPPSRYVTITALPPTRSLRDAPPAARPRWDGFSASNCL